MTTNNRFHVTRVSSNKKTGPMPVTTTSKDSCPLTCPLINAGCYAKSGPLALHWNKVSDANEKRSLSEDEFLAIITKLPKGQLFRHNQAGDFPHVNGVIIGDFVSKLIRANKNKRGFTYTHHDITNNDNLRMVQDCNLSGFTVNHSADNVKAAVKAYKRYSNVPIVTLLPIDAPNVQTVEGVKVVACPAEKSDKINCANCGLCAIHDRNYVIGFRVHGTQKKIANIIAIG
jgi:hypothetical protein